MYLDYPPLERGKDPQFIAAKIKKINTRAEIHGPDKKTALDFNYVIEVPVTTLELLSLGDKTDYKNLLFDEKGMVKNHGIKNIKFLRDFENHFLNIAFVRTEHHKHAHRFLTDNIGKFSAEPKAGFMILLNFQVQFKPHAEKDIGELIKRGIEKECYIRIEHSQDDIVTEANKAPPIKDKKQTIGNRKAAAAAGGKPH